MTKTGTCCLNNDDQLCSIGMASLNENNSLKCLDVQ